MTKFCVILHVQIELNGVRRSRVATTTGDHNFPTNQNFPVIFFHHWEKCGQEIHLSPPSGFFHQKFPHKKMAKRKNCGNKIPPTGFPANQKYIRKQLASGDTISTAPAPLGGRFGSTSPSASGNSSLLYCCNGSYGLN